MWVYENYVAFATDISFIGQEFLITVYMYLYPSKLKFGKQLNNHCHFKFVKINIMSILSISVYTIITVLVQSINNSHLSNVSNNLNIPLSNTFPESKRHSVGNFVSNKNDICKNSLLIDNINNIRYRRNVSGMHNTTHSTLEKSTRLHSKVLYHKGKGLDKREIRLVPGKLTYKDINLEFC